MVVGGTKSGGVETLREILDILYFQKSTLQILFMLQTNITVVPLRQSLVFMGKHPMNGEVLARMELGLVGSVPGLQS